MTTEEQNQYLAHRRARAKMGWFLHAAIYLVVNIVLLVASSLMGKHWAVFPLLGWGLGLAIHGAVVWLKTSQWALQCRERMVARELQAINQSATPR